MTGAGSTVNICIYVYIYIYIYTYMINIRKDGAKDTDPHKRKNIALGFRVWEAFWSFWSSALWPRPINAGWWNFTSY